MPHSALPRAATRLFNSLHQHLDMYALAASAAGVGVLALAQPAEAKIIYTRTHQVIGPGQHYDLDLNHDKKTDFTLVNSWTFSISVQLLNLKPAPQNGAIGYVGSDNWRFASAMNTGEGIGPRGDFQVQTCALLGIRDSQGGSLYGPWYNARNRYLGLKFEIKGKSHYGWARLNVKGTFDYLTGTLTGYAYETIPNKRITAGKTKGEEVIVVDPTTLGHLARGAAAIQTVSPTN